jgi:endonuclease/exonuclease/phosphatase family metal-dependent hydrolase
MVQIVSMNINAYGNRYGVWEIRREIIRQAFHELQPDVLALQAVSLDPALEKGRDQCAQIAKILPQFQYTLFQPAVTRPDGSADGLATLSRAPILESDCFKLTLLPGLDDTNPRVILHTRLELPGGVTLELFNANFSWIATQARQNTQETLAYLSQFSGLRLLVGDLNQTPDSEMAALFATAGWVDAWKQVNPEKKGFTFVEDNKFVKRLDYAWASPELAGRLESLRVVANNATMDGARGSDHAALLIALR